MNDSELNLMLAKFDFSLCEPIRKNLREKLLETHRRERRQMLWSSRRISDFDLDYAAAAGNFDTQSENPSAEENLVGQEVL